MKRALLLALVGALALGAAGPPQTAVSGNKNIGPPSSGFPRTLRVRLWYLHPPAALNLSPASGQAHFRTCPTCKDTALTAIALSASGTRLRLNSQKRTITELRITGVYQMKAFDAPSVPADFPVDIRASGGRLLVTATLPMDEYIAGVLAGETGNFKSDEALKAMSVAARTYAMHFGSRHALDHFDVCDTTHCQDLRLSGITGRIRQIAESTSGEVLWWQGRPAATYYHADCGGMTEDARFVLGDDEAPMPYLKQHSDIYCIRNGIMQWQSQITKRDLRRALAADGFNVLGKLRSVSVVQRTPSGRVETLRVVGSRTITVPGVQFRIAVGRHIGWARLKSNWYDVSMSGDLIMFHGRGSGHGVGLCQVGAEVMGEEGKTYQEILAYYYPGTKLGRSAQGIAWHTLTAENVELLTTRPDVDRTYLPLATSLAREAQATTGLAFTSKPEWKLYPTVAMFRDATGEPGWVAAATRGHTIQTQPADVLQQAGTLESTLRHELLHMLIEAHVKPGTPVWFREGLVLYLSEPNAPVQPSSAFKTASELEKAIVNPTSEDQLRKAYTEAHSRVAQLAKQYGKQKLILWVQQGLPPDVTP
jgi:stage II sporulation protein D